LHAGDIPASDDGGGGGGGVRGALVPGPACGTLGGGATATLCTVPLGTGLTARQAWEIDAQSVVLVVRASSRPQTAAAAPQL
jgi:hypothetical protein